MADEPSRTPGDTALLLDAMLGKLTTYLRMCGYDAVYALDRGVEADDALLELAASEDRLLVTRDAELARRVADSVDSADSLLLESKDVTDQLLELADAGFALELGEPSRCARCNGELVVVAEEEEEEKAEGEKAGAAETTPAYAPDPDETTVWRCRDCGQHFWKGSHWDAVAETLADL